MGANYLIMERLGGWYGPPTAYVEYYGMTATAVCNDNATKVDDKAHLYCEMNVS